MNYDQADYYDCASAEHLTYEGPAEAIEGHIDGYFFVDCDVEAVIAALCPIVCTAYVRKTVGDDVVKEWAEQLAEQLNETWSQEEYGNPDEELDGPGDPDFVAALIPVLRAAVSRTEVYGCDKLETREYSEQEVLTMMREHRVDWFEK